MQATKGFLVDVVVLGAIVLVFLGLGVLIGGLSSLTDGDAAARSTATSPVGPGPGEVKP